MAMAASTGIFEIERAGDTLIVTPTANIGELAFQEIESGTAQVLKDLNGSAARNVVIDLRSTDYFGTTAVSLFLKLWERVRERNGRMVFCNVSEHEHELLRLIKLESLWMMAGSREEALQLARQ
jgi:anti-anti-sigma factor